MGPMMGDGGWGNPGTIWLVPVLVVLVVVAFVVAVIGTGRHGDAPARRPAPGPADILRDRYVRGEITRRQYREALVDVLKDRFVRGELGLDEYEEQLDRLLATDAPRRTTAPDRH